MSLGLFKSLYFHPLSTQVLHYFLMCNAMLPCFASDVMIVLLFDNLLSYYDIISFLTRVNYKVLKQH